MPYLASFDPPGAYSVRSVEYVGPLSSGQRTDYAWASVSPAFEPEVFMSGQPIEYVALAPRHAGASLHQPKEWPVHVYVCVAKSADLTLSSRLDPDELRILNWGLLYPTRDAAAEGKF